MKPDYPLLGLLARNPASGYDLGKWLRLDGQFLGRKPSMSPIYRALNELKGRGWVTTTSGGSGAGPEAKVYALTPAGREALIEWARSEYVPAARPMSPDFMVRMNFAGQLGPEYALRIVQTELAFRRAQRQAEFDGGHGLGPVDPVPEIDSGWLAEIYHITHDRGWQNTSLYIGWLETTERYLLRRVSQSDPDIPTRC